MRPGILGRMGGLPLTRLVPLELHTIAHVDCGLLEALADHAHAARLGPGVEGLAAGQGLTVEVVDTLAGGWAAGMATVDGVIIVRRRRDPAEERLVALHEIAHHLLDAAGVEHTHADVWRLTLALGAPRAVAAAARNAVDLAAMTGLPAWAAGWRIEHSADDPQNYRRTRLTNII